ncbi:MAG: Rieske (2Fe-2S) protein [Anaerolineales bacterium]|jgi:3-phenylpropionate/trans-cinnamate dioxygenase ferredoxin subunit
MEFVEVLDTSQLPEGQMTKVTVHGKDLLLAHVDGAYYAIANKCTHLGGSLSNGELDGSIVTCPRHGARFDVKTGESVRNAKIAMIKMQVKDEESFPVKVEGNKILVGAPADQ